MFAKSQLKLPFGIHSNFPMGGKISSFMCQTLYTNCLTILLVARGVNDLPQFQTQSEVHTCALLLNCKRKAQDFATAGGAFGKG